MVYAMHISKWVAEHKSLVGGALLAAPFAAFAEGADQFAAFDTALTSMSGGLTTLVGKMAPAIVSIALIVLILPAVSWIVRRVRGALS